MAMNSEPFEAEKKVSDTGHPGDALSFFVFLAALGITVSALVTTAIIGAQ